MTRQYVATKPKSRRLKISRYDKKKMNLYEFVALAKSLDRTATSSSKLYGNVTLCTDKTLTPYLLRCAPKPSGKPPFLTVEELAEMLRVKPRTLKHCSGSLPLERCLAPAVDNATC